MRYLLFILSFVILTTTLSCKEKATISEVQVVSSEEMQTLLEMDDVQLVDVRTPEEYKEGYIDKSQNIDFQSPTFLEDISKLDKSKPVLVYCRSGGRSARCAEKLKEAGFIKIYDLEGGISKWKHEGFDVKL
jgi:rhodanese-related sulfurtransferase